MRNPDTEDTDPAPEPKADDQKTAAKKEANEATAVCHLLQNPQVLPKNLFKRTSS